MEKFNWGIIGPGNIARSFADDLKLLPGEHRVTSVLGHTRETLEKFAADYNVLITFTDLDEFVQKSDIDAVYIATPHPQHLEQALACINHRIPVLCEKPITINAAQSKELIAAANRQQIFLMEGMWLRFLPSIKKVLELIASNAIGDIQSIRASIAYKAPKDPESRYFDPELGGGSLLDLGIYPVFLSYLLLGKPRKIEASGKLSKEGIDEECKMSFYYQDNQSAILSSSLLSDSNPAAEIIGELGTIRILEPWFEKSKGVELELNGREAVTYPCDWEGHGLQFEAAEVLSCISSGKFESDLMSHGFTQDVMEIMDEVRGIIRVEYPIEDERQIITRD